MGEPLLITLYLVALIVPGLAIHTALKLRINVFLSSTSFSYSLFALTFITANHFSLPANNFIFAQICIVIISIIFLLAFGLTGKNKALPRENKKSIGSLACVLTIIATSILYQLFFSAFTEIPSDLYSHMERYQTAFTNINNNSLGQALPWQDLLFQRSGVFYYLLAGASWLTSASSESTISAIDFANRTLFLIAVYFFSYAVFARQKHRTLIAASSVAFVTLHMGINVFAYVRYYSLAPTMLNMIIYMSAVVIFISTASQRFSLKSIGAYVAILLLIITAAAVHVQEAMYIGIMVAIISTFGVLSKLTFTPFKLDIDTRQSLIITIIALTGFISIYLYSHYNLDRAPNAHWRLWEFGAGVGFIPDITTLNLKLQFAKVMTLWGLFVYGLFFLHIKRYLSNPFILAAMLSPIATFLNPFFVDLFLRHYNSTTLWRLCYLIPIHFVAADLFVHYASQFRKKSFVTKLISTITLVAMVGLLLPIKNTWQGVHYSRFPTLERSDKTLSYPYYNDLISYLESLEKPYQVLTDPMTGYVLSAMTKHTSYRRKFFRDYRFKSFTFQDYSTNPLAKYKGYLLVTNQRLHSTSRIGELSGHWRKDEWQQVHHYYPPQLTAHLKANPQRFTELWRNDGVVVYSVN